MNSLYNHGVKQTQLLTKDLGQLEKNLSTSPLSLQGSITTTLNAFRKTIKEYGDLVKNLGESEKHQQRLDKFNEQLVQFNKKFSELKDQRESVVQEANKQELLGRRTAHTTGDNPYEENPVARAQQLSNQEHLYNERQSLSRGTQQLDYILEMGQQSLEDLVDQNETLKRLGAKFEESLITLGVSQGTIRTIERRARQDKWLFWGGVLLMFFIFYLIVKWLR